MRIGLDARTIASPRPRGTGRNLRDLFAVLPSLRPDWQFLLYHQRPLSTQEKRGGNEASQHFNVEWRHIDCPGDRLDAWFQFRLPLAAVRDRVDLLHFPASVAPAWCPVPFVITVHDLIPLRFPGELSPAETRAFAQGLRRGVRRAPHNITVSEATRARMTVIPWAADQRLEADAPAARRRGAQARVRARFQLSKPWWLSFSGRSPRKNALGLLRGFAATPAAVRTATHLVLVGCEPDSYRAELVAAAQKLGIGPQTHIVGYVPHADLAPLLVGAHGLLMPSRYEGFGLPILDACALGVPVLTSNVSSMPEVAGDAAIYCDPDDPHSIARGIAQLFEPDTAAELIRKGRRRAARFSWRQTAEATIRVYHSALEAGTGSVCAVLRWCNPGRVTWPASGPRGAAGTGTEPRTGHRRPIRVPQGTQTSAAAGGPQQPWPDVEPGRARCGSHTEESR